MVVELVLVVGLDVDFDGDGNVNLAAQPLSRGRRNHRGGRPIRLISDAGYQRGLKLLQGVVAMLTKMV